MTDLVRQSTTGIGDPGYRLRGAGQFTFPPLFSFFVEKRRPHKNLVLLGSTGSIGTQSLDVARDHPERFTVVGLSSRANWELLARQCEEFRPKVAVLMDPDAAEKLKSRLAGTGIAVRSGLEDLIGLASLPEADTVIVATVGSVGLRPTYEAIRAGKSIALANKEVLVMAGEIMKREARRSGSSIVPIDSEHSAIFQCLRAGRPEEVRRILITASGGPFRNWTPEELQQATLEDALKHPTWDMGAKVTIDSASLLNKGFEVIECHHLFDVSAEKIQVVIHPESVIHSMVEFHDGSIVGHLGKADMRIPIRYALSHPERLPSNAGSIDLVSLGRLTFEAPDLERFPCLRLAYESLERMGSAPVVLAAAGEAAVESFVKGEIAFPDVPRIIESALKKHSFVSNPELEDVFRIESWVRSHVSTLRT